MQPHDRDGEQVRRRQRLLVTVICVAFTVVGVLLMLGDDPGAWVTGLVAVVFFGGIGLVYWGLTAPRGQGVSEVATAPDGGVTYSTSLSRTALRAAGSGIFVVVGLLMMFSPGLLSASIFPPSLVVVVGTVCVLFFGMVLVLAAIPSLLRPGGLVLTSERISYHSGLGGFSGRWSDIDEVQTVRDGMLGLRATETRLLHTRGPLRLLSPVHRRFWGVDVAIPLQTLRSDPETVEAAVVEAHGSNGR